MPVSKFVQKVRLRQKLPVNMDPKAWIQLVFKQRPEAAALGAMDFFKAQLVVVGWIDRQVIAVGVNGARPGTPFFLAMPAADQETLTGWIADYDAGRLNSLIEAEAKARQALMAGW